jgi:hypothetical protein
MTARVTLDVLMRIEDACRCGILKVLARLTEGDMTTTDICNVLLPALRAGSNDIDAAGVKKLVWEGGLPDAMKAVGDLLSMALTGGNSEGNAEEAAGEA